MSIIFSLILYFTVVNTPLNKLQTWYFLIDFLINNIDNTIFFLLIFFYITRVRVFVVFLIFTLKYLVFTRYFIAYELPKGLLIGYNVIHPPLFYLSLICGIVFFFEKLNNIKFINTLVIGIFGILLGGAWGLGNSIWGFFWVDDFIEIIFLSYLLAVLLLLHLIFYKNYLSYYFIFIFIIITLLVISRWGLVFTRHSFFNILSIHNLFFIFLFFYFFNFLNFFLIFLTFQILSKYCVYAFILFLVSRLNNSIIYSKRWILLHMLFLLTYISWVKVKEYNLLYFFVKYLYNLEVFSLTWGISLDGFFLFFFKKYSLSIFKLSIYTIYSVKYFITTAYISILAYSFFFYITLISMYKIYVNYLQN